MAQNFLSDTIHGDGVGLMLGTGGDAFFKHDGSNFNFFNDTGDVNFTQRVNDGQIRFYNDDGSGGTEVYLTIDGNNQFIRFDKHARFNDSDKLQLGIGSDFNLFHDGTNSYIQNYAPFYIQQHSGVFSIEQHTDAEDIVFKSDDGSGGVAEYYRLDGGDTINYFSKHVKVPDGVKMYLGSSQDLEIYHDTSNNLIKNIAGNLDFEQHADNNHIRFYNDNGSGGVALYFHVDGSTHQTVFHRETVHVDDVFGTFGTGSDLKIHHDGTDSYIRNTTGALYIQSEVTDGNIVFSNDDGTGGGTIAYFSVDGGSATHDGSATSATYTKWYDKSRIALGSGKDLQLYHDGSNTYIENGTGILNINNSGGNLVFDISGDITLDAGGNDIRLFKAGVEYGKFKNDSGNLAMYSSIQDEDIIFRGNDGGSIIDALTLDMSNGGSAVFLDDVDVGKNLNLINASSPTIHIKDTTNNCSLKMYAQDSNAIIGTYSDHPLAFYTDSGETLTLNTNHSATFAGTITSGSITATGSGNTDISSVSTGDWASLTVKSSDAASAYIFLKDASGERARLQSTSNNNLKFLTNGGGSLALTLDSSTNATFEGDVQAPGIYVGSTNASYDFYNNGTSYLNGATTIDANLTISSLTNYTGIDLTAAGASRPSLDFINATQGNLGRIYGTEGNALVLASGSSNATTLTLDSSNNANFAGDVTISADGTNSKTISVAADTDYGFATIGRMTLGKLGWDDHAGWKHVDAASQTQYAFLQNEAFDTFMNAGSGRTLYFRTNNSNAMYMTASAATFAGTVTVGTGTVAAANAAADDFVITGPGTTATGMTISNTSDSGVGTIFFGDTSSSSVAGFRYDHNTGDMAVSAEDDINFTCDNATFAGDVTMDNSGSGDRTLTISTTTGGDPTIIMNSDAANRSGLIKYQDNGTNIGRIEYAHASDALQLQAGSATGWTTQITNGTLTTKAAGASNSILAQWQVTNGTNAATFRTTDSGFIFRIHAQNSGTIYVQNDDGSNYLKIPDSGSNEIAGNTTFTGELTAKTLTSHNNRGSNHGGGADQEFPIGHWNEGEEVFSIDPTWTNAQLQAYFGQPDTAVEWLEDSTAPSGWAIKITGGVYVGGAYDSGFPYIAIEEDAIYYMECHIRGLDSDTSVNHYMGSIDYKEDFTAPSSGSGNPGSYGYWVMSNATTAGQTWTKATGIIRGFHNTTTGMFETGAKYWTPQALFNYSHGAGTRACVISGWRVVKISGKRMLADGAAGTPSLTFAEDQDTGIFRNSANSFSLTTGGTQALSIDSSQNATVAGNISLTGNSSITAGGYLHLLTAGGGNMYTDLGGTFYIRDIDSGNADRFTLNSANGDCVIGGDLHVDNNSSVSINTNSTNYLQINNAGDTLRLAGMGGAWCHVLTSADRFYFDKPLWVDTGNIGSYNEDVQHHRGGTNYARGFDNGIFQPHYLGGYDGVEGGSTGRRVIIKGSGDNSIYFGPYDDNGWGYLENYNNSSGMYFNTAAGNFAFDTGDIIPYTDNEISCGGSSNRFTYMYCSQEVRSSGDVVAYYSDERLKNIHGTIPNALDKVLSLTGFYYTQNETAKQLGYENDKQQVGVSAQEVQKVLPEAVGLAPVDMHYDKETKTTTSKSGEDYLTVKYEKIVPLLIESIKELKAEIDELKKCGKCENCDCK